MYVSPLRIYSDTWLGTSNSWRRWVLPFTVSQAACVSCLSSHWRPKDTKGGECSPLCLSSSFGCILGCPAGLQLFPEPLLFLPLFLPLFVSCWILSESCTVVSSLFEETGCYRWSDTGQSCGLCPVACIRNWHSTLAFPGCLASSGALKIVSVNYVFRSYVVCNILFIFRLRKIL